MVSGDSDGENPLLLGVGGVGRPGCITSDSIAHGSPALQEAQPSLLRRLLACTATENSKVLRSPGSLASTLLLRRWVSCPTTENIKV